MMTISRSPMEACRNASTLTFLACFFGLDSDAKPSGIKLGLIGEGILHRLFISAPGFGMVINEVALKARDQLSPLK